MTTDEYVDSLHEELNEKEHRIAALEGMVRMLYRELNHYYNTHPTKVEGTVELLTRAKALLS